MSYFNEFKKCIVFIGFISIFQASHAGSYVDFFRAILRDDAYSTSRLLAEGFDPNTASETAQPALLYALRQESYKAAKVLIADPRTRLDQTNPQDESPLMMAALKGQIDLVEQLISQGAAINKPGWTPLHYAATASDAQMTAVLIRHRADLNAASPNGTTPLMMAARYGSPESVQMLLKAGADVHATNQMGLSALDFAKQGVRPDAVKLIEQALDQPQWPSAPASPTQQ